MIDKTYHDEDTMFKVFAAVEGAGYSVEESNNIINSLFDAGILFRERVAQQQETDNED